MTIARGPEARATIPYRSEITPVREFFHLSRSFIYGRSTNLGAIELEPKSRPLRACKFDYSGAEVHIHNFENPEVVLYMYSQPENNWLGIDFSDAAAFAEGKTLALVKPPKVVAKGVVFTYALLSDAESEYRELFTPNGKSSEIDNPYILMAANIAQQYSNS